MLNVLLPYEPRYHSPSTDTDPAAFIMASFQRLYVCITSAKKKSPEHPSPLSQAKLTWKLVCCILERGNGPLNDAVPSLSSFPFFSSCLCLYSSPLRPSGPLPSDLVGVSALTLAPNEWARWFIAERERKEGRDGERIEGGWRGGHGKGKGVLGHSGEGQQRKSSHCFVLSSALANNLRTQYAL